MIENVKLQKTTFSKEDALLIHEYGPNSQEETNEEQLIKMLKNEGFYQSVQVLVNDIEDNMKAGLSVVKLMEKFASSLDFNLNALEKRGF